MANNTGTGKLQVRVTSGYGAFPQKDAIVTISERTINEKGKQLYSFITDESGLTPTVDLSAPPRDLTYKPQTDKPYSLYDVTVKKDGFYDVESSSVQIFDGIKATQIINLIPKNELDSVSPQYPNKNIIFNDNPNPSDL